MYGTIMTILSVLFLLAISNFQIHEHSVDEWVDARYSFAIDEIIDPSDYAGVALRENADLFEMGSRAFFIDTPDGEVWRVLLLFRDKLVVLQQDQAPDEYQLPDPGAWCFTTSQNGNWVVICSQFIPVSSTSYPSTVYERRTELVNVETGDRYPLGSWVRFGWAVSGEGSVLAFSDSCYGFVDPESGTIRETEFPGNPPAHRSYARSSDGSLSVILEQTSEGNRFIGIDSSNGREIWYVEEPSDGLAQNVRVTPDGNLVFSSRKDGLVLIDGRYGTVLDSLFEGESVGRALVSSDGTRFAFRISDHLTASGVHDGIITGSVADIASEGDYRFTGFNLSRDEWQYPSPKCISSNGFLLFSQSTFASEFRWGLLDGDNQIVWISDTFKAGSYDLNIGNHEVYTENWGDPHAISTDGSRFIFCNGSEVVIARLLNVN
jgi:hypothetical protein